MTRRRMMIKTKMMAVTVMMMRMVMMTRRKKGGKKKGGGDDDGDGRLDLPEGGDGLLSRAKRASSESLEKTAGYKASKGMGCSAEPRGPAARVWRRPPGT